MHDSIDILLTGATAVRDSQKLAKSRLPTSKFREMVLLTAAPLLGACTLRLGPSSNAFSSKGSFTVAGGDAGAVTATFAGMSSYLAGSTPTPTSAFIIDASTGDGSAGTFMSPAGVTSYSVSVNITLAGAPSAEATYTNGDSCGDVSISYGSSAVSVLGTFELSELGWPCTDVDAGSWILTFTSVSAPQFENDGAVYFPHGTFTATIPNDAGESGVMNFSF